jgi:outer membrane protein assembly factor BamB
MNVLTRSFDSARTGANLQESALTPAKVASNLLVKHLSLVFDDDPRLEAQPLYMGGLRMNDGKTHDVVFICTMANNIWAFDANDGQVIWKKNIGQPIQPKVTPVNGFPHRSEIDIWGINFKWGILSTPVIDPDTNFMYVVNWTSPDGALTQNAKYQLHEIKLTDGTETKRSPLDLAASANAQTAPGAKPATYLAFRQKQRASLLLVKTNSGGNALKTLFIGCGMTHEEHDTTHGWLLACDISSFRQTAAWCTTPNGLGCGIWQAGQGPSADENGDVYVMTGNYGVVDNNDNTQPPQPGDLPQSLVKLHYTPPTSKNGAGKLQAVAWFTPFVDSERNPHGQDDFQDYDLGSAGPVIIPGMQMVVGCGKDGVLYVLDTDTAKLGQGSDFSKLKQPPIFFTYFPGFGIDASKIANLDQLFDGKTHHLHGSPAFWRDPTRGPMLFCWGENECLRAWTINAAGTVTFVAKSTEVASANAPGNKGGMPGGLLAISSNGATPNTGIIWALAPISGDANQHVVEGILRAYDASVLDRMNNADGTPRLKLLWDSKHLPGNTFNHCKFCPPVIANGKVFVPTYDGRVDVYGLVPPPPPGPLPTNARNL